MARPRIGRDGIASAVALAASIAAGLVVLTAPPAASIPVPGVGLQLPLLGIGLPAASLLVVAALALTIAGWRTWAASPDAGALLLLLACLFAGAGAHGPVAMLTAPEGASPASVLWLRTGALVAYVDLFVASAVVVTLWGAAPERALGPWVGPLGLLVVCLTLGGAIARAQVYPPAIPAGPDLSAIWRSGVLVAALWLVGAAGAVRAAGLRYLAMGRPALPTRVTVVGPPLIWATVAIGAAGWVLALRADLAAGDAGSALGPLLWLLVGAVALRSARVAAWSAFTLSLTLSAGAVIDVATPLPGWALLAWATVTGWSALVEAAPGRPAELGRSIAAGVAIAAILPGLAGAEPIVAVAAVWVPSPGVPFPGLWTPGLVFVPVLLAGLVVARRRLVVAVAEAEAVAGDPFVPSRYVGAMASELITGQARVRSEAAELERRRLASDLHADVLPGLAQAAADTAAGASPEAVSARLRIVESDVRGLLAERRHVVLEELGLVEALEWLADRAEEAAELESAVTVDPATSDERPPRAVERAAYRVAQLAVDNAVRHAGAKRLAVEALVRPDRVRIEVADDGRGFDPSVATGGFGLADMRLQAAEVGARVEVRSEPGDGTRITFSWPRPQGQPPA